jgi:gliding-associated putative ABC transporter substrate-binding component GldG
MNKRQQIVVIALGLLLVVAVGLNVSRFYARIDLTESKAFTISRASQQLFREIPEKVFITYYLSEKLRSLYSFPMQIEDLLYEYAAHSRGKIQVEVVDPLKSGQSARVQALGIPPQQIEVVEKDQRSYAQVYTGIAIQYLDRHETIPVVSQIESLEYDLTSRIRKVVSGEERVVGIVVGDATRSVSSNYATLSNFLSADFTVRELSRGEDIPADVDVLFVLGDYDLQPFDLFPIDQFIMRGGKVLFAVEGMRMDLQRGLNPEKLGPSPLLDMLAGYGVRVKEELVLDRSCRNFRLPTSVLGGIMWQVLGKYPYWVTVSGQSVSRESPVMAHFQGLDLYWASPLEPLSREGVSAEVLAQSSPQGWTQAEGPFQTDPQTAAVLLSGSHEGAGRYPLAIALQGRFASYFKGRAIPTREGEKRDWREVLEASPASQPSRLVVVGDADFASEIYQYSDAGYNMDFLGNAAEWLSNSDELLQIKNRTARDMRLDRIQDPALRARAAGFTQAVNVGLIPLGVVAFGIVRFLYRRRKSEHREREG